jgi:hypothetical protein
VYAMFAEIDERTGHDERNTRRECATCRYVRQAIVL